MPHEERFDRIDANIAEIKELLTSVAGTSVAVAAQLSRLEDTAAATAANVSRLEATLAAVTANLDRLTQFVLDFRGETVRQLEIIDNRLNLMAANINAMEARFAPMNKAMMEFGQEDTRLNVELSRHRSRMDSLEEQISKIHPAA